MYGLHVAFPKRSDIRASGAKQHLRQWTSKRRGCCLITDSQTAEIQLLWPVGEVNTSHHYVLNSDVT